MNQRKTLLETMWVNVKVREKRKEKALKEEVKIFQRGTTLLQLYSGDKFSQ